MATSDPIYRGMNLSELDVQYDARGTVDDIAPFLAQYADLSAAAKRDLEVVEDIPFGPSAEEMFDLFPAGRNAPVFVFVHGGYWRLLSKNESSFMARCFVDRGIAVAAVNYALAPTVTLDEIVRQVRAAVSRLWHDADRYGIDRNRIHIGGSSAGGHLVGMLLAEGWKAEAGVPANVIAGAVSASGLFDLEPVRLCSPNEWLQLDAKSAHRNSPIQHIPEAGCPLMLTWAGSDTDEFKRQSRDYGQVYEQAGFSVTTFEVSDRNHFDIILDLADPEREFAKRVIAMIEGAA